ncbi:hypothetical protein [Rhodococcus sp. SGAir0479]|uniref:hypothetical protein n=1 Tax=Rhodococcus sp. SGAir0479 TaxID=2567884 RepID=UPI0010CCCD18|nr:hypothetical protein [Rhodococcus sp. SGAir0479]QCQ91505.1 hypothetical protein E7742_09815 [Rhodococcus sp. SGAir0479]
MTVQAAPPARIRRSTAAQRAYDRRRQRATVVGGHPAPASAPTVTAPRAIVARIPFVATVIGLLCLGLAATLLLTTRAAEDSYELADARAHNQSLRERTAALARDVAAGNSAPVLAAKAAEQGLIPAKDPARLVMDADGTVHVVGTPKPAEGKPVPPLDRTPVPVPAAPAPQTQVSRPAPTTQATAPTSAPAPTTAAAPTPTQQPATPQSANDGRIQARGEQSTLVTVITQPPAGARQ